MGTKHMTSNQHDPLWDGVCLYRLMRPVQPVHQLYTHTLEEGANTFGNIAYLGRHSNIVFDHEGPKSLRTAALKSLFSFVHHIISRNRLRAWWDEQTFSVSLLASGSSMMRRWRAWIWCLGEEIPDRQREMRDEAVAMFPSPFLCIASVTRDGNAKKKKKKMFLRMLEVVFDLCEIVI